MDTLNYIPAGSRYHMYRMASNHPRYAKMTESDLINGMCYRRNTSTTTGRGDAIGFGRLLASFDVVTIPEEPWVYLEAIPRAPLPRWDTLKQSVTLTDGKSFAFILNCWTGSNQRAWDVHSISPQLNPGTRRLIEDHAASLGFRRENMIFLRYDSCRKHNPLHSWADHDDHQNERRPGGRGTWVEGKRPRSGGRRVQSRRPSTFEDDYSGEGNAGWSREDDH